MTLAGGHSQMTDGGGKRDHEAEVAGIVGCSLIGC